MPPKLSTFKAFGFEFPVTRGVAWALGLVAVVGTAGFIYQKLYSDPERVILSLKEVNAQLAGEVEEFGRHVMEEPTKHELFTDPDGELVLRVYPDHCVLIQRRTSRTGMRTKLVPDLAKLAAWQIDPPAVGWATVYASEQNNPCARGCLNPHPGPFQWWYGERKGDWVEVWRRWPCACQHVQLFLPRLGVWDTNPDGTPRVRWSCCVH